MTTTNFRLVMKLSMARYIPYFKKLGYAYSKDKLGEYFTRGSRKLSIMFCGPAYNCFVNDQQPDGSFMLVARQMNILGDDLAYKWIVIYA